MRHFIFYTLLITASLAPLPFGANRPWAWNLIIGIAALLSILWAIYVFNKPQRISMSLPGWIIVCFFIPLIWSLLQIQPWMPEAWLHPVWGMTQQALANMAIEIEPVKMISLSPQNTLNAAFRLLSYGLFFFLSFQLCRSGKYAKILFYWLAVTGMLYALYGLIAYWGNFNSYLWFKADKPVKDVVSTFINHSSYATYAGLGLISSGVMLLIQLRSRESFGFSAVHTMQKYWENILIRIWPGLVSIFIIYTAMLLSHSRGAFLSASVAIFFALIVILFKIRKKQHSQVLALIGIGLMMYISYEISHKVLLERMANLSESSEVRLTIYWAVIEAIKDNLWLGYGYGTFSESFHLYRDESLNRMLALAHNTYLENIFELGLPALSALFLSCLGLFIICIKGIWRRQRDWIYPLAGATASLLVAIHALSDFSLQMPAVAMTYSLIMGAACAQSIQDRKSQG